MNDKRKGKNDNETYHEILNDMYKPNYSTMQTANGEKIEQ